LRYDPNPPAAVADIQKCEADLGFLLPTDYKKFLATADGGEGFIGPNAYVIFYRVSELVTINRLYSFEEYAPGLFMFGSDGGGEAYAFDTRVTDWPIVSVPFVGSGLADVWRIAPSFRDFLAALSKS
jgi:hypothetical protein